MLWTKAQVIYSYFVIDVYVHISNPLTKLVHVM